MKKTLLLVILALALMFCFAACGGTEAPAPQEPAAEPGAAETPPAEAEVETIVWDFLDLDAAGHPVVIVMNEWADDIYERSNGQLKINIRVGGELPFATNEYLTAASQGSVQMAGCMANSIASDMPCGGIPSLLYLATDYASLATMMEVLDPFLNEELEDYNLMNLMTIAYPPQEIYGQGDAPASYTELEGMKLRTSGSEQAKFWEGMGLVPTAIDASEVISSLSKNVINGVTTAVLTVDMSKWCDNLDWAYICGTQVVPAYCVANIDAFNSLPADVQQVLVDVSNEYKIVFGERMDEFTADSYVAIEEAGMEIVYATDEDLAALSAASSSYWDAYAERAGGKAKEALAEVKTALGL